MQFNRTATAVWLGSGKEGTGHLTTQSTALDEVQYSFNTRFADGIGTNPEELLAAAHAGCFNMKLSFVIGAAGFKPEKLETLCTISLESSGITKSHLALRAEVPGISQEQFEACVADAEKNCPVSKLFNTEIVVDAQLV
jgi:lipoyl-dependent peroxiredoxin